MTPDSLDTYATPMPVCPYCGYESRCVADLIKRNEGGWNEFWCQACERGYCVTIEIVHTFTTRKKAGDE